jgi:EF-hand domain pair/EF hand
MNTLAKLSIASALMLSASFGIAVAEEAHDNPQNQEDGDGPRGDKHHGGRHGERGMRIVDANNDGVISADEAASLADHAFMRMDDDQDGKVTEAEFIAGPRGKRGWFDWDNAETAVVQKLRTDKFAALDANRDKSLDKTEYFADAKAKLAAADTDKDGKVTPWEFRASR